MDRQELFHRTWPAGLVLLAIFLSSSTFVNSTDFARWVTTALPGITEEGFNNFWKSWWWVFVKGWHATEFAILFFVIQRLLGPKPLAWSALLTCGFAALDEIHQLSVPFRGGRVSDVLIDAVGILMAWRLRALGLKFKGLLLLQLFVSILIIYGFSRSGF